MDVIHGPKIDRLMADLKAGKEYAFEAFFREMYPALRAYGLQITGNKDIAEDLVQNAFMKIWERRASFNQYHNLKSYMYTMVRNGCYDYLNAARKKCSQEESFVILTTQPEKNAWEKIIEAEMMLALITGLEQLPPRRQQVIKLLYREGKSVRQTAELLGITTSSVKEHKAKAVLFLRHILPMFAGIAICNVYNT